MSKRSLRNAVVVITGASSGIGRATAIRFASRGANLVLAARDEAALAEVAASCVLAGGRAFTVPTDVSNPSALRYLADTALHTYDGRIDIWVNNAGIGAIGGFSETPIEVHDQVIQTNLLGYIHGAHAVLPVFKQQHEGILINNISFGAWFPAPYAVAYSASKYGLVGYSAALRGELYGWPGIHVCDVFPSFINTPGLSSHAANYSGRKTSASGKAADPFRVAEALVALAQQPKASVTVGLTAQLAWIANLLAPGLSRWLTARGLEASLGSAEPLAPTDGALFETQKDDKSIYGINPGPRRNAKLVAAGMAVTLGFLASRAIRPRLTSSTAG